MATKVTDVLRRVEIFERLPDSELGKIAKLVKERKVRENQILFRQGDRGDALYIITQGRVKVFVVDQFGRERVLAFLGDGQFFGDMALLTGAPRSAGVQATVETKVLQLRKDEFDVLLQQNVEIMKEMLRVVSQRTAETQQRIQQENTAESGKVQGLLTVVFSPRGGAGKSTLAVNLAVGLAQIAPDRAALADFDLLFPQAAVMLNLTPKTYLSAATPSAVRSMDRESFTYYLTTHEDSSLRVLVGSQRPEDGEVVTGDHVRAGLDQLRRQFLHVVVDTYPSFSDANLAIMEAADQVLMVVTPELVTVRDVRECKRIFNELLGLPPERFKYVLNEATPYKGLPRDQIEQALEARFEYTIPFGGEAPSQAALDGWPLVSRWPNNPVSKALQLPISEFDRIAKETLAIAGTR